MEGQRIVITGVSGLLGNNLARCFRERNEVVGFFRRHPVSIAGVRTQYADLFDYRMLRKELLRIRPDVVLHCASRTDVDTQETDPEGAWDANVLTSRNVMDSLRNLDARCVFVSTDSVYAGDAGPYRENSPAHPMNCYGRTKLEAENACIQKNSALAVRTNLYGWNIQPKESIAEWALNRLLAGQEVNGFTDARFSSIYTMELAGLIEACLDAGVVGLYNCASRDSWSKYEFCRNIARTFGLDESLVKPIHLADAKLKAPRGRDLSLDVSLLEKKLGREFPTMQDGVDAFFRDWKNGVPQHIRESNGGPVRNMYPVRDEISYGGQALDGEDLQAVANVLRSSRLTQGEEVEAFEDEVRQLAGARHAIAVSSGTAALHVACQACGVGPGLEAVTSSISFLASANCAVYCGGWPVFADIDPLTVNLSPESLRKSINEKTRVVIPVHFAGQSCDMKAIHEVVREAEKKFGNRIFIIEDASHALGSEYAGTQVGSCTYSDMAVLSFHPVKHITTGEGGMVLCNDGQLASVVRRLRSHGVQRANDPDEPWKYSQVELGYNYRITDLQCALGRSQLKKLPWFMQRRRAIVDDYNAFFSSLPNITTPKEGAGCRSNFHLYVVRLDFPAIGLGRGSFMRKLGDEGILTQVHYIPIHLQPFYRENFGTRKGDFPIAESYYEECLTLPLYPAMSDEDVAKVKQRVAALLTVGA